ncbi:MAG: methionine gamma-lyase family protein [Bacilli bacterium]|jgi:cystathionine beta-lyase family protein involved in aluminum resistance
MILENINSRILNLSKQAETDLKAIFEEVDETCLHNSNRILSAFIENRVEYSDFTERNGYGNFDTGRDKIERIFASVLGTEDALVRAQIMSGTNALYLTFSALLKQGDTMVSITGKPYDSLLETIGIIGDSSQSLKANGVNYEEIDLTADGFDLERIKARLARRDVKLVEIQRSRGYSSRRSLTIGEIEEAIKAIRSVDEEAIIVVDNCYGELVERKEPGHVGADVVVGSLMKNLGGGIASTGGYIAGKARYIAMIADRLTAPGIGKNLGANFNQNSNFFKGLFLAPNAVKSALKTQIFAAYMLEKLGFTVSPRYDEYRTDIIQTVQLKTEKNLIAFARSIQASSPVDSGVHITPAPMPGYPCPVIMAAGCFTEGSTIELSADAPCVEPYTLYMQGGLTYEYGKLSIMSALSKILENK